MNQIKKMNIETKRLKGQADAADEGDYLTFLTQGLFEMRSGSMEVKQSNISNHGLLQKKLNLNGIKGPDCLGISWW